MTIASISPSLIIMGIDPGSRITGYGLIRVEGNQHYHLASGCLRLKATDISARLQQIFTDLKALIGHYRPQEIAVERIFLHRNPNPAGTFQLAQARGAALVAVQQALCEIAEENSVHGQAHTIAEYSTREIKQAVVGHGGAKKDQVQFMVRALLNLTETPTTDAADALAAALCHSHRRRLGSITNMALVPRRKRRRWQ